MTSTVARKICHHFVDCLNIFMVSSPSPEPKEYEFLVLKLTRNPMLALKLHQLFQFHLKPNRTTLVVYWILSMSVCSFPIQLAWHRQIETKSHILVRSVHYHRVRRPLCPEPIGEMDLAIWVPPSRNHNGEYPFQWEDSRLSIVTWYDCSNDLKCVV